MPRPAADPPRHAARPYHHGDLHAALLAAAEEILERDGLPALTLRAAARAAGVSHAAPAHHFGDLTGLLSELAAQGYQRFAAALREAIEAAGGDSRSRLRAMGRAYVRFAKAHRGMFMLMFRAGSLDFTRPALSAASNEASRLLRDAILARSPKSAAPNAAIAAEIVAAWSLVHGFAMLLIDGRLDSLMHDLPGNGSAETLLDAVLGAD